MVVQRPREGEVPQLTRGERQSHRAYWEVPAEQLVPGLETAASYKEQ